MMLPPYSFVNSCMAISARFFNITVSDYNIENDNAIDLFQFVRNFIGEKEEICRIFNEVILPIISVTLQIDYKYAFNLLYF
ncbi:hypothetical protein CIL05_00135 [Virgibacillus profundi]|uniref:Uncharacterized protein n=1 Tax=Virgibacillus profundi TaxID=2024555 RepID=A0A2A2IJ28_9BACI|nr:hypothetical protein CIL05_00135 [Virgibacillus profundi]PXY55286.1 hypothetical protein CIT14_00135 [Virgibacillus profundi]